MCFGPCCRALNIRQSQRTPNPHVFQVLGFTPTLGQSRVATDLACDCSSFLVSYPSWNVGGLKLACTKIRRSKRKTDGKKKQVSYDPKDEPISDPIFAEATITDSPDRNPSQNFHGSDYFEASVKDVPLHTTFTVPAFLVQSGHVPS